MAGTPILVARNLTKRFGDRTAVDGIDLEIPCGQIFGLLGPNGAGKSTTIHMLIGLLRPDAGRAEACGLDPRVPAARQLLGIAPQSVSLYDDLTAAENLRFFGQLYGVQGVRLQGRMEWALDLAGLSDRARDRVRTFSGGMKRRLNIAVGLIHEPHALLLDEPTVGVDPQSRNHILDTIQLLAREGLTILYTTHYMEEAQRLCDCVAIMDRGQILANDTVPNLIQRHGGLPVVQGKLEPGGPRDSLPGLLDHDQLRFESPEPIEELARLHARGIRFREVQITRSDLEGVFLSLTGRSLRD